MSSKHKVVPESMSSTRIYGCEDPPTWSGHSGESAHRKPHKSRRQQARRESVEIEREGGRDV